MLPNCLKSATMYTATSIHSLIISRIYIFLCGIPVITYFCFSRYIVYPFVPYSLAQKGHLFNHMNGLSHPLASN